jgi:hypothetical protein
VQENSALISALNSTTGSVAVHFSGIYALDASSARIPSASALGSISLAPPLLQRFCGLFRGCRGQLSVLTGPNAGRSSSCGSAVIPSCDYLQYILHYYTRTLWPIPLLSTWISQQGRWVGSRRQLFFLVAFAVSDSLPG